ncbi:MAG TPA: cob(I)yrinic acid a,c-diamide adenosyltransferase [Candidatus Nitrosocosmicus sp.]|nr:cob(I)yrinic acid a,c-diamide adenosyltransferase [Candidatus Nitrosocosmicus sp.]
MKIYTKSGDKGKTSLFNGSRVNKTSKRIISYGIIDEVNSHIGILISLSYNKPEILDLEKMLLALQKQLFVLGSDLANPSDTASEYPRITSEDVTYVENQIDDLDKHLEPLISFILPGGSIQSSHCHVIRTVIRRAEISMAELYSEKEISESAYIYINRLSDLFFMLARTFNKRLGKEDIIWKN